MNKQEYEARFHTNQKLSGFGSETTMHMPCPFCAAPDFVAYKILEMEVDLSKETICKECSRGCKAIFTHDHGSITFEFVQTSGEDHPDYLPKMRRV